MAALGALGVADTVLLDTGTAVSTAQALPVPARVITDRAGSPLARWAADRGLLTVVDRSLLDDPGRPRPPRPGTALKFLTSGTTGAPKVIEHHERQVLAAAHGVAARLGLGPQDVSLTLAAQNHTLGFITGVLAPLMSGGTVAFGDLGEPAALVDRIRQSGATWCAASPAIHRLVHDVSRRAAFRWPGLRFLRSSAAPLTAECAADLEDYFGVPIVNAYVLTEAPGEAASQALDAPRTPGTVGTPSLCEVEIRDGVVCLRGPNVTGPPGWFTTGDLGTLDATGVLTILGRCDDLINRGGFKIEPHTLEAAALRHPHVAEAAAFPISHSWLGSTVGLVVTPRPPHTLSATQVRRHLQTQLSRRMWPDRIVVADEIPRTDRGKISRRTLAGLLL
ncbi:class I adenylate-forming enzyme family protein [Plantactinospora sp. WMMC1484]|uniref:class I adenylate-forming enzyme family protein n=1 Tax=Plantactinospora sp. WMMC1484 TaxID=3404122 RepID=UPI003BF52EF3